MHEVMLYERLPSSRVRCNVCQWYCTITSGKYGVCRVYQNKAGKLYNLNYARVSSMAADPVEKKPLFHFFPGSLVFSLGGWGCNFHCRDCQNWEIACSEADEPWRGSQEVKPELTVELAKLHHCQGIAWTYNEPSIWFEYTLDSAKLAKQAGLYTVYVTNGYLSQQALDTIGPYLDAWRVDIKGFSDSFYSKLTRVVRWQDILKVTKRAKDKWNMHVEVITNIIPTMNDDDQQLKNIAYWIRTELGELTPWHVTRFYPRYHMNHLLPTPVSTLERAADIGREAGLRFIYAGNVPGHSSETTVCYSCGRTIIERFGYRTRVVGLKNSGCQYCDTDLNFVTLGLREAYHG